MNQPHSSIPPKVLALLTRFGKKKTLNALEVLVRVGEQCNSIFFVQKGGFLRRFYNEKSSTFRTISFHLPSHRPFLTINESFFARKPSSYEIKSFQQSEVLECSRELIEEMSEKHEFLKEFQQARILEALLFENEFKSRLISYSSAEFYEYLCNAYPEIIKHVPSKYIAEVMRISPEWLSKLRQKRR